VEVNMHRSGTFGCELLRGFPNAYLQVYRRITDRTDRQ
jgi:hypothetical protein